MIILLAVGWGIDFFNNNTLTDKLDSIMEALRTKLTESGTGKKSRIYIFLLDNLEYFCDGTQSLLYNLFDSCASGQVGCLSDVYRRHLQRSGG